MGRIVGWVTNVVVAALGLSAPCAAQAPAVPLPPGAPFAATCWTVANGLPQNSIGDVLQARDGFLWVGTFGGLCCFDGSQWRVYDTASTPGLGGNRIVALYEDGDGTIWVGSERGGLAHGGLGGFVPVSGWRRPWVGAIRRLPDGRLLAAADDDVYEVSHDGLVTPVARTKVPGVRAILPIGGRVVFAGIAGLHELDDHSVRRIARDWFGGAAAGPDGRLAIAGNGGLQQLDGPVPTPVPDGPKETLNTVFVAADGAIWYGSTTGLGRFVAGSPERSFRVPLDHPVRAIAEDVSGGILVGTIGGGLLRLRRAEVVPVSSAQGLVCAGQNSVAPDGAGGVFVATHAGLYRGHDRFELVPAVGNRPATALLADGDDLWIGLPGELGRLRGGGLEIAARSSALDPIKAIERVGDEIWMATGSGVFVLRDDHLEGTILPPEIGQEPHFLGHGQRGEVWVASAQAVVRMREGVRGFEVWRCGVDLPAGELRAVVPRPGGRTWLGIYGGGFVAIDPGEHAPRCRVDQRNGLFDHAVCSVAAAGELWVVGANRGTYAIEPAALDEFAEGRAVTVACRPLAGPSGADAEANGGFRSNTAVVGDTAWLCGLGPMQRVGLAGIRAPLRAPTCYIDRLYAGTRVLPLGEFVDAPVGERAFLFHLGACEFDRPDQVRFRWRLTPGNGSWSLPAFGREARFEVDGPGDYVFEAEALACDEHVGSQRVRTVVRVPPLWHERISVRLGTLVAGAALAFGLFRFGHRRAARRAWRLQVQVDARTAELRHAREHLEERVRERTGALQAALVQIGTEHERKLQLERELELLRRMESVGSLAGGVAHDFNNLLTIVLGNAALLELELREEPETAALAVQIREAGERGRRMTRHLLAVASRQAIASTVVDLDEQIAAMLGTLRHLLGASIELRYLRAGRPARVLGAATQFEQILLNLAVNARDAMTGGGEFEIALAADAGRVTLRVHDDGPGMSPEVRARAFEPFFTTKPKPHGTGLGLATVYGITKQLHGEVELDSAPGRGTTFVFRWPEVAVAAVAEHEVVLPPPPARLDRTVLLVEDEADVRAVLRRLLERAGCTVHEAGDGDRALALLQGPAAATEVVLSDVQMPGLAGVALAAALREARPGLPIVFLSGHAEVAAAVADLTALGFEVLGKPPETRELLDALRRAIADPASRALQALRG